MELTGYKIRIISILIKSRFAVTVIVWWICSSDGIIKFVSCNFQLESNLWTINFNRIRGCNNNIIKSKLVICYFVLNRRSLASLTSFTSSSLVASLSFSILLAISFFLKLKGLREWISLSTEYGGGVPQLPFGA